MQIHNIYRRLQVGALALVLLGSLGSCKKNVLNLSDNLINEDGSFFKFNWVSPSFSTQGVQVKINGERVSNQLGIGFTSTTQYVMPFPGGGLNTGGNNKSDYLLVPAGTLKVSVSVPKKGTNVDSIVVHEADVVTEKGKFHSIYVCDSFPNAKSYQLADDIGYADSGYVYLRFTNAVSNLSGNMDFLINNPASPTDQLVATNIAFKGSTAFLKIPYVPGTNTFKLRKTGTTTIFASAYATSGMTNRRAYTVIARGYEGGAGIRGPIVSLVFNK